MNPELKGIDIFIDEKSLSKMNDRDIKQYLLDQEDGPEGIIIYHIQWHLFFSMV